jgi:hypothetical protein
MTNPAPARRAFGMWPLAAVLITLTLVVGIPFGYLAMRAADAPARVMSSLSQAAADAVRPKISMNEIILTSISDLHKESKLVVLTTDVNTDVTREEGASSWGVYWGTNVARVAVKEAKVQYVIDTGKVGTSDFVYDEPSGVLSVTFPRPHVDTSMVSIDPGKIQTLDLRGGWARFDKQQTRERAFAELRPKVITQAQASYVREIADAQGIAATTQLLQPLAETLKRDNVTLRVSYRD